ncbi:MAG TPA: matrixin family metalloprotease [Vicinamibacteria bacterium]
MRLRTTVLGLLAAAGAACGGGGRTPTGPAPVSTPPPGLAAGSTVSVISAETGAPVGGATVTVAGRGYRSDAGGQVRIEPAADLGAFVDVVAPGMLDRQTLVRTGETTFSLWPRTTPTGIDENYTAVLVYTSASSEARASATGGEALMRLPAGTTSVVLVPSAAILADGAAHEAQATAVANINAANGSGVRYTLANALPATGVGFELNLDPADEGCSDRTLAFTESRLRRSEIVGGRIVYCSLDDARDSAITTHEVGHTFGLQHSPRREDVMYATYEPDGNRGFSPREATIMHLMSQRRSGNRFPDTDRGATSSGFDGIVIMRRR